jgi:hypothetical protein
MKGINKNIMCAIIVNVLVGENKASYSRINGVKMMSCPIYMIPEFSTYNNYLFFKQFV